MSKPEIAREDLERAADRIEADAQNKRLSPTPFEIEDVAKICHEANKALCQSLGDLSQVSWELAPQWQMDSAIKGVKFILENPDAGPSASHESWLKVKEAEGWKYGPVKSESKKEHPCYVPYEELPPAQQAKDHLFGAIVRGMMPYIRR